MNPQFNLQEYMMDIGYAEMYEYADPNLAKIGRFVGFSDDSPGKISLYSDKLNANTVIGVTAVNAAQVSNYYKEWPNKYMRNEFGDAYIRKEPVAVGKKHYDEIFERSFIVTKRMEKYIGITNPKYDESKPYINRCSRPDWAKVVMLGQVIITDNGQCEPGSYCKPYDGEDTELLGTAMPATKEDMNRFYVVSRMSPTTIIILMK